MVVFITWSFGYNLYFTDNNIVMKVFTDKVFVRLHILSLLFYFRNVEEEFNIMKCICVNEIHKTKFQWDFIFVLSYNTSILCRMFFIKRSVYNTNNKTRFYFELKIEIKNRWCCCLTLMLISILSKNHKSQYLKRTEIKPLWWLSIDSYL